MRRLSLLGALLLGCRPAPATPSEPPAEPEAEPETAAADSPPATEPPVAEAAAAEPAPATFDKHTIRTVVRSNIGDVRRCYNQGLATDPNLAGRVAVQFTIGPEGTVFIAEVIESQLPKEAKAVERCLIAAVENWQFPRPPGEGNVMVTYPFVLEPGDSTTSASGLTPDPQTEGRWFPVVGYPPNTAVVEVLHSHEQRTVVGAKVTVRIRGRKTMEERIATTDRLGRAVFPDLPPSASIQARVGAGPLHESVATEGRAMGTLLRQPAEDPK